jgi:hypothetical protein
MADRQRVRVRRKADAQSPKSVRRKKKGTEQEQQPALLKGSNQRLGSREIMNLQRRFGNTAVQRMLVQRSQDGDQSNPPIKEAQLTLQTTPPEMGLALQKMLMDIFQLAESMDMSNLELRVMEQTFMLRDLEEMAEAYLEANNLGLVGSMLKNGELPTDATENNPFQQMDERLAAIAMSPGVLIGALQQAAIQLGKILVTNPGTDTVNEADHEVNAAIERLEGTYQPLYETVADGQKAVEASVSAIMQIWKLKRQKRR